MAMVELEDIRSAQRRFQGIAVHTPLVLCPRSGSERLLYFKPEGFQPVGSFKLRGAYNKIASLSEEERTRGVVAYSSGNHAQGVAYAARKLGVRATIVMLETIPQRPSVNGTRLFYELSRSGDPLVLVHGSWVDHKDWQLVVPSLTKSFRVLTYDRRGHSLSERLLGLGSRREDEEDLDALIEALDLAPAHVATHSFGASTALGLAARRPDLFRSLLVHEAPLMGIVADDAKLRPLMKELQDGFESVLGQLRAGDIAGERGGLWRRSRLGPGCGSSSRRRSAR